MESVAVALRALIASCLRAQRAFRSWIAVILLFVAPTPVSSIDPDGLTFSPNQHPPVLKQPVARKHCGSDGMIRRCDDDDDF